MANSPKHENTLGRDERSSLAFPAPIPELNGAALFTHPAFHQVKVYRFGPFAGITLSEVLKARGTSDEALAKLRRIMLITKSVMSDMNRQGEVLPNDSAEKILRMQTKASAHTPVLEGWIPGLDDRRLPPQTFGFNLGISDPKDFPDLEDIPADLLTPAPLPPSLGGGGQLLTPWRIIRAFVVAQAREYLPRGAANDALMEALKTISRGHRLLGKMLVGPDTIPDVWKQALDAAVSRGFAETPYSAIETISRKSGRVDQFFFRWYTYPAMTDAAEAASARFRERYDRLNRDVQKQMARTAAFLPSGNARIICLSDQGEAYNVACAYPGNFVTNIPSGPQAKAVAKPERRINLATVNPMHAFGLPPASADVFLNYRRIELPAIREQLDQLKTGGVLFFYGQTLPNEILLAELRRRNCRILFQAPEAAAPLGEPGESFDICPASRALVVAQKAAPGEGIEFVQTSARPKRASTFLSWKAYERDGERREIAKRPNPTIDIIPVTVLGGRLHVWGKGNGGFPRPITRLAEPHLDGASGCGSIVEQLAAELKEFEATDDDNGLVRAAARVLQERSRISPDKISHFGVPSRNFTAAALVDEEVLQVAVHITPDVADIRPSWIEKSYSGYSTSGGVQLYDALQLLRACHANILRDPRLERKIFEILIEENRSAGSWVGAPINLTPQPFAARRVQSLAELLEYPKRHAFRAATRQKREYLEIWEGTFAELDSTDSILVSNKREYVMPARRTGWGNDAVSVLPIVKAGPHPEDIHILVEIRDFPAVQEHRPYSRLVTNPFFHLRKDVRNGRDAGVFVRDAFKQYFGGEIRQMHALGGKYFASPGVVPLTVYPVFAEVDLQRSALRDLYPVSLTEFLALNRRIECGQLLTAAFRAAHGTGLLK